MIMLMVILIMIPIVIILLNKKYVEFFEELVHRDLKRICNSNTR